MTIDIFHVSSVKTWLVISADSAVVQKPVSAYVNLVKIWFKKVKKKKKIVLLNCQNESVRISYILF